MIPLWTPKLRHAALALGVIVVLCYIRSLHGDYHFDDEHALRDNLAIRSLSSLPSLWTDAKTSSFLPENHTYRPLTFTFYTFCWVLGNGATWPFHVVKLLLHTLFCLALFTAWSRLWRQPDWWPVHNLQVKFPFGRVHTITPEWAALALAALFAVHPAASECVNYLAATTSLQCAVFYAWAFVQYLWFRDTGELKRLALSLFLYFCSVASKEEGITLPAMILVTEVFLGADLSADLSAHSVGLEKFRTRLTTAIRATLPFALMGLVLAAWLYYMHPTEGNESRGSATSFQYFITQWRAYLWYMRLWFWPWDLNADISWMKLSTTLTEPAVVQAALGNLALLAFGWFNRKRFPAFLFGMVWFYVTISPASSVVVLSEPMNEHRMYLAYFGFVGGTLTLLLALAEGLAGSGGPVRAEKLTRAGELARIGEGRPQRLGWLYVLLLVSLTIGAQERIGVWLTGEALWLDTVAKNPDSVRALNNLGNIYLGQGKYDLALENFKKCEQLSTHYMYCPLNVGTSYSSLGQALERQNKPTEAARNYELAEQAFGRAIVLNPRNVYTNFFLGRFLAEIRKNCGSAHPYLSMALEVTGGRHPEAAYSLAKCQVLAGNLAGALQSVDQGLAVEPTHGPLKELKSRLGPALSSARTLGR